MHGCVNGKKTVGYVVRLIVFWFVLDRRIRDQTSEVSARLNLLGSPQEPLFITTTPDLRFSRPNQSAETTPGQEHGKTDPPEPLSVGKRVVIQAAQCGCTVAAGSSCLPAVDVSRHHKRAVV
ncbi:hypothetical protein IG631_09469 [Alternaria alternata]|nr:hypothetical protein IG631_09469 [Alternaria alternata]